MIVDPNGALRGRAWLAASDSANGEGRPFDAESTYTYSAGRLSQRVYAKPSATSVTVGYNYDVASRLVSMSEATGTTDWTYDTLGNATLTEGIGPGLYRRSRRPPWPANPYAHLPPPPSPPWP